MNNLLQLNFNKPIPSDFLAELQKISPVKFKANTKDSVVVLSFEDGYDCMQFKRTQSCWELFKANA